MGDGKSRLDHGESVSPMSCFGLKKEYIDIVLGGRNRWLRIQALHELVSLQSFRGMGASLELARFGLGFGSASWTSWLKPPKRRPLVNSG